jgi:hypothetical protein
MSKWFRFLAENFEFIGDKGYKGVNMLKYVKINKKLEKVSCGGNFSSKLFFFQLLYTE